MAVPAHKRNRRGKRKAPHSTGTGKKCCNCGATRTPQWREGPEGPKTLCNACGVRYSRGKAAVAKDRLQKPETMGSKESSQQEQIQIQGQISKCQNAVLPSNCSNNQADLEVAEALITAKSLSPQRSAASALLETANMTRDMDAALTLMEVSASVQQTNGKSARLKSTELVAWQQHESKKIMRDDLPANEGVILQSTKGIHCPVGLNGCHALEDKGENKQTHSPIMENMKAIMGASAQLRKMRLLLEIAEAREMAAQKELELARTEVKRLSEEYDAALQSSMITIETAECDCKEPDSKKRRCI